ncbi:MAG: hypothetical protein Q8L43_05840, partial [Deltaproteobacteria bacterium]|nr:hypothetical protein [Deltaproteobacteria bacterium]
AKRALIGGKRCVNTPGAGEGAPPAAPASNPKAANGAIKEAPPPVPRHGSRGARGDSAALVKPSLWRLRPERGKSGKFLDLFPGYDINKKTSPG